MGFIYIKLTWYIERILMIKITAGILISSAIFAGQMAFAETSQQKQQTLSPEEIKLQKDKIKYKAYIPQSYTLFEAIEGDLNKDGQKDLVLIVKGTDSKQWIDDEYRGRLDRNRRGILVFLNQNGSYKKVVQNLSSFSSENEDGGVYFAPELSVEIIKNKLFLNYGHGRYGWWGYSFRLENNDMRLIGYENSSNHGPYISSETSVNLLTGKKLYRKNMNEDDEENPRFKETWSKVSLAPIYLSKIKDFDELLVD